jgi:hypothetical protein
MATKMTMTRRIGLVLRALGALFVYAEHMRRKRTAVRV